MSNPLLYTGLIRRTLSAALVTIVLSMGLAATVSANGIPAPDRSLGISSLFGRWDNATVNYYYNPANAPAEFSNVEFTVALIQQATAEWSGVSGLQFNYMGTSSAAVTNVNDGVVVIGWSNFGSGGATGLGGPSLFCTGQELQAAGYCHFVDGSVQVNLARDWGDMQTDFARKIFVRVLVHELGHLVGLGHSNDPDSVMFANPYNNLSHPRADDIEAVSALYGLPLVPFQEPPYSPPAVGNDPRFTDAYFAIDQPFTAAPVTVMDDNTSGSYMWFTIKTSGAATGLVEAVDIVTVDPSGMFYSGSTLSINCPVNNLCSNAGTVGQLNMLATVPGTWTVHLIADGQSVLSRDLQVSTKPVFNTSPIASLNLPVNAGPAPLTIHPSVSFNDLEGDNVTVVWHVPGSGQTTFNSNQSSGTASDSFTFGSDGTYTFWVEVNDDATHYGGAGTGFQTLLTATIHVGDSTVADGDIAPLGIGDGEVNAADVLVAHRAVTGVQQITSHLLEHGDVFPPGAPDQKFDVSDLVLIMRQALGL